MTTPLVKFKKALQTLASHNKAQYYKDAYSKAVAFINYMSGKRQSVEVQLSTPHAAIIQTNRKILRSIMATVEVCGRQAISLRDHRDDAKDLDDISNNPGNFQALLQFQCAAGDTVLAKHLQSCARNATYHSKTTQNEIVDVLGSMITETIVAEVKKAKFFSVISNEIEDAASVEQISLVVRYVHKEETTGDYVVK